MIRKVTDKSRGIRLGNYVQIRAIEDEELEQVWNGKKTAKEALDADRDARQRAAGTLPEGEQELTIDGSRAWRRVRLISPAPVSPSQGRAGRDFLFRGIMEKRVFFRSGWLPWLLLTPQMAVILVFFFWPAGQAILQSLQQQDAFGTSVEYVGFENFRRCSATRAMPSRSRPRRCSRCWWPASASACR
jgi:hypothetical protein